MCVVCESKSASARHSQLFLRAQCQRQGSEAQGGVEGEEEALSHCTPAPPRILLSRLNNGGCCVSTPMIYMHAYIHTYIYKYTHTRARTHTRAHTCIYMYLYSIWRVGRAA